MGKISDRRSESITENASYSYIKMELNLVYRVGLSGHAITKLK